MSKSTNHILLMLAYDQVSSVFLPCQHTGQLLPTPTIAYILLLNSLIKLQMLVMSALTKGFLPTKMLNESKCACTS